MMVRLVMGREGQTTFGYCCYCCHHRHHHNHHQYHHHHHYCRHTASIVLIAIIGLIYIPAPGKSMWGITNMTRRTESEFSGFSPKQPMITMMITITTRSGSETYEGEFVNGLRHGKVIDHFLSSTQTPHTFHIMEKLFRKTTLRTFEGRKGF